MSYFIYNESNDTYICPQQQVLTTNGNWYKKSKDRNHYTVKHYKTNACATWTFRVNGRLNLRFPICFHFIVILLSFCLRIFFLQITFQTHCQCSYKLSFKGLSSEIFYMPDGSFRQQAKEQGITNRLDGIYINAVAE